MNKEIHNQAAYFDHFSIPDNQSDKYKKQSETLKYALEIRKFEIDLYWKRTGYFWGLIAATFAGYISLQNNTNSPDCSNSLIFLVTCIGLTLSLGWYLANRGSKYWQENWERHVDVLEDNVLGPLYKTTLAFGWKKALNPLDSYPFSVSKINQILSLYITLIWFGLSYVAFQPFVPSFLSDFPFQLQSPHIIALITFLCLIFLLISSQGSSQKESTRKINFISTEANSSNE